MMAIYDSMRVRSLKGAIYISLELQTSIYKAEAAAIFWQISI